jgi:hypothetical protein
LSRCYKNTDRKCIPRRCKEPCYIKYKKYGNEDIFTPVFTRNQQKKANEYFVTCFEDIYNEVVNLAVELTREKFGLYPNIVAINICRKRIVGEDY